MADTMAELRAKIVAESHANAHEPKWGYFGFTGPLAIGDDSLAPRLQRKVPESEAGEPIHNILTGPMKKGAGTDVYFSFLPPLCDGDPYIDPMLRTRKPKVWQVDPEASFKPPGTVKYAAHTSTYEYKEHMSGLKDPTEVHAKYKDVLPIRNFYTNPAKKGGGGSMVPGVLFGMDSDRKVAEYVGDDYDAPRKMRLEELASHRAKLQEQSFKGTDFGQKTFQIDMDLYKNDIPGAQIAKEVKEDHFNKVAHEAPFRPSNPSKKGLNSTLNPFPEHLEDPHPSARGAQRKPKVEGEEPPPSWRPCHPGKVANPMSSVVSLTRNMRAERPSAFRRPCL